VQNAGVSDFDVEHGLRADDALRACRRVGAPERIKDASPEDHRMPVPSAVRRARDRSSACSKCNQQRRDGCSAEKRKIDWRDENGAGARVVGRIQPGEHRRQLTGISVVIGDESNGGGQPIDLVAQRPIVGAADDKGIVDAAVEQRRRETGDERHVAGWHGQKGLGTAHARGKSRREDDSRDQAGRIVLLNGTTLLSVATTWL